MDDQDFEPQPLPPMPMPDDDMERERLVSDVMMDPVAQEGRWCIQDKSGAFWAVRQISRARAEMADIEQAYRSELERLNAWRERELGYWQRTERFFEQHLAAYHRHLLVLDPKAKTIRTPWGSLQLRAQQPELEYDVEALLPWLKAHRPELVQTHEKPSVSSLRKLIDLQPVEPDSPVMRAVLKDSGEVVEGVRAVARPPAFTVKTEDEVAPE